MSMKRKAEEAERRADELYAQHFGSKTDEGVDTPPEPVEGDTPPETALSQDDAVVKDTPPEPVVAPETPPEPPPTPAPEAEKPKKEVDWEHKYKVLQGKYNKEVAGYADNQKKLTDLVQSLDGQVKSLSESLTALVSKDADGKKSERLQSIEQLKEEYPTIYAGIVAQVEEQVSSSLAPQLNEVKEKIEKQEKVQAASAQEVFFSILSGAVPDWQDVNNDPAFHEWLQGKERYARVNRYDQLKDLYEGGDAKGVADMMRDFKEARTADTERKEEVATATKTEKERKVAPESAPAPAPKVAPTSGPRTYTTAYITKFYNDYARGKFDRNLAEYDRIDADIQKAAREGRIIKSKNIAP